MENFGTTQTWLLSTYSARSPEKTHFTVLTLLTIGTTLLGSPSIFTDLAGVQLHKEGVKHFLSMNTIMRCPTSNKALLTFGYVRLCGIIVSDHHRHSNTRGSLPGKWAA